MKISLKTIGLIMLGVSIFGVGIAMAAPSSTCWNGSPKTLTDQSGKSTYAIFGTNSICACMQQQWGAAVILLSITPNKPTSCGTEGNCTIFYSQNGKNFYAYGNAGSFDSLVGKTCTTNLVSGTSFKSACTIVTGNWDVPNC